MIRTYTRKPQECQYIEGVLGLCRLCLRRAEDAVPIFTDPHTDICSSLALRIMFCVGLELKHEEDLPNNVCSACFKELELYYAFRKKCEVSHQKLKSHLQAIQNRRAVDAVVAASEEAIKQIDAVESREENVSVDDLEQMMGSEECYGVLEIEAVSSINDVNVPSDIHVAEHETNSELQDHIPSQETVTTEVEELPSMITGVLVKLGFLTCDGPFLSSRSPQPIQIQLETADTSVVRMEVVEEDDESAAENEEKNAPAMEDDFCLAPLKQENHKIVVNDEVRFKILDEVKPAKKEKKPKGASRGLRCGRCARILPSASALRRHARTHSGERPFACPRCARRFAQKEVMLRHTLVHEEVRPHACPHCPKSFTQRSGLLLHARAHVAPHDRALPLHSCPHCPKLFLYSSGLSRHMMTHAGRLYECGACRRQFADKSSVLRHLRTHAAPPTAQALQAPHVPTGD